MPHTLAPPPRRVPLSLQAVNLFNGFAQIGWFVFGFGMLFVWIFVGQADLSFLTFRGPHAEARGKVVSVEDTHASENDTAVRANHYEYSVAGQTFRGTSYTTGAAAEVGSDVTVEYDEDHPMRSRIAGMRRAVFGPGVSFVAIFALVGALLVWFATRSGVKRNRLLRNGVLTTGKFMGKRRTNVTINDQPVMEAVFEFTARDGRRYEATARSTDLTTLTDEAEEPLLYDPDNPAVAYVLDEAPARPQFEMNGELRGAGSRAFLMMIIPGLVIAANLLAAAFRFLR